MKIRREKRKTRQIDEKYMDSLQVGMEQYVESKLYSVLISIDEPSRIEDNKKNLQEAREYIQDLKAYELQRDITENLEKELKTLAGKIAELEAQE